MSFLDRRLIRDLADREAPAEELAGLRLAPGVGGAADLHAAVRGVERGADRDRLRALEPHEALGRLGLRRARRAGGQLHEHLAGDDGGVDGLERLRAAAAPLLSSQPSLIPSLSVSPVPQGSGGGGGARPDADRPGLLGDVADARRSRVAVAMIAAGRRRRRATPTRRCAARRRRTATRSPAVPDQLSSAAAENVSAAGDAADGQREGAEARPGAVEAGGADAVVVAPAPSARRPAPSAARSPRNDRRRSRPGRPAESSPDPRRRPRGGRRVDGAGAAGSGHAATGIAAGGDRAVGLAMSGAVAGRLGRAPGAAAGAAAQRGRPSRRPASRGQLRAVGAGRDVEAAAGAAAGRVVREVRDEPRTRPTRRASRRAVGC